MIPTRKRAGRIRNADPDSYCTPPEELILARHVLGGIDLDPCSNPRSRVRARQSIMLPRDGLAIPWRGRVFLNPPYSRIDPWLCKMIEDPGVTGALALLPANTDTAWFHEHATRADAICFSRGRTAFLDENGHPSHGSTFGSLYVYRGGHVARFIETYQNIGACFLP